MGEEVVRLAGSQVGGTTTLIRDEVGCKGSFLLHYILRKLLSDTESCVVLVGLAEPLSHYFRIARKQGCNLQSWRDKGRFMFVEHQQPLVGAIPSSTGGVVSGTTIDKNPLSCLYMKVRDAVSRVSVRENQETCQKPTCIIIDDVSLLEVIAGGSWHDVVDFLHYCKTISLGRKRCSVVLLLHQDICEATADSFLSQELETSADAVINVEPLSTGLAADVHGQLTILFRTNALEQLRSTTFNVGIDNLLTKPTKLQFRITENNISFFTPGAVLKEFKR